MTVDANSLARLVVTGVGEDGRSRVASDGPVSVWVRRPTGIQVMDLWRVDSLPSSVDAESTTGEQVVLNPPEHGVVVRTTIFPPDSSISPAAAAAYAAAMADIYGAAGNSGDAADIPGMHQTETIDVMTVIDGELCALMEDGETVLKAGDTMVQRGTRHAWRNRTDRPTTVVTIMMPATRPT